MGGRLLRDALSGRQERAPDVESGKFRCRTRGSTSGSRPCVHPGAAISKAGPELLDLCRPCRFAHAGGQGMHAVAGPRYRSYLHAAHRCRGNEGPLSPARRDRRHARPPGLPRRATRRQSRIGHPDLIQNIGQTLADGQIAPCWLTAQARSLTSTHTRDHQLRRFTGATSPLGSRPEASPARAEGPRRVARSVPLAFREAAKGDQAHERDDEPDPEAPHDHQDDADDDEDAAESDAARVAACAWL